MHYLLKTYIIRHFTNTPRDEIIEKMRCRKNAMEIKRKCSFQKDNEMSQMVSDRESFKRNGIVKQMAEGAESTAPRGRKRE